MKRTLLVSAGMALAVLLTLRWAHAETAQADLLGADKEKIGTVTLTQTRHGVLLSIEASKLAPGAQALHIHEVGRCEPPFTSAGGHFNPAGKKHGLMSAEGMHAGDLPNVYAGPDGTLRAEILAAEVTLAPGPSSLLDSDGSAVVLHAGPDDYKTDPAGSAGARIACGVIVK
jgi:Cu-Zn family superoxide dismutase